jgi:hypothetical protein
MITQGQASVCKNDDKRKDNENNLFTSIPAHVGEWEVIQRFLEGSQPDEVIRRFAEGSPPDGLTVYGGYMDPEVFRTVRKGRVPNPNQNWNSLARRVEAFKTFLAYCRQHDLKIEFWDVHYCQRSSKQLQINEKNKAKSTAK